MIFFVLLTYIALAEGYLFFHITTEDLKSKYKEYLKDAKAVLTVDLEGPFEATCVHMTPPSQGGTFKSDDHTSVLFLSAVTGETTKEIGILSVDECNTPYKIKETIKSISPLKFDTLPAKIIVTYRGRNGKEGDRTHPYVQTVNYELKGDNYVKKEST